MCRDAMDEEEVKERKTEKTNNRQVVDTQPGRETSTESSPHFFFWLTLAMPGIDSCHARNFACCLGGARATATATTI